MRRLAFPGRPAVEYSSAANRLEALLHLLHDVVDAEARRSLARRKLHVTSARDGRVAVLAAMPRRRHMRGILAGRQLANDRRRTARRPFY